jgi:hypothetical protein
VPPPSPNQGIEIVAEVGVAEAGAAVNDDERIAAGAEQPPEEPDAIPGVDVSFADRR